MNPNESHTNLENYANLVRLDQKRNLFPNLSFSSDSKQRIENTHNMTAEVLSEKMILRLVSGKLPSLRKMGL